MKRIGLSILFVAAAVMTACEKERTEIQPVVENAPYIYSVKATISSETRTDYDADGNFSWTAGDKISVLFHNDETETNKFFTLTADAAGETATFSGTIDAGYEIGALDGTDEDAKIWALYPASDQHTYADGSVSFYVKPSVDFTETGFSANIPMYDLLTEEGAFEFKNMACTYKFIVKDLDAALKKVRFTIFNQTTFGLSGLWPINTAEKYVNYGWAESGSEKSTLTYISNVTDGEAVFYVSCRYWGTFQPAISVYDAETGFCLKEFTASNVIDGGNHNHMTSVKPITLSVPTKPFVPAIKIDGDFSDWDEIEGESNSIYGMFKATSDTENIYFYSWRTTGGRYSDIWGKVGYIYLGFDLDGNSENGVTLGGNGPYDFIFYFYPYGGSADAPAFIDQPKATCAPDTYTLTNIQCKGVANEQGAYIEYSIPRADLPTIPNTSITITSWGNKDLPKVTLTCTL